MRFVEVFRPENVRKILPLIAMYLMLGLVMGYLFFSSTFYYYCEPLDFEMQTWQLILAMLCLGLISGYLYPDITHVIASAFILPLLGVFFFFLIFISPTFIGDIVDTGMDEAIFVGLRPIIGHLAVAFLTLFVSGFIAMYLFESD